MDSDQTLKILRMVQEGFLTPEQGQRLLTELLQGTQAQDGPRAAGPRPVEPTPEPPQDQAADFLKFAEEAGRTVGEGLERLFGFAGQTVRDGLGMGPQEVVFKVLDADGILERYQVKVPYGVLGALKSLLTAPQTLVVHPLQRVDWSALFAALESGRTGKVFEYIDHARAERLEVWVR